MREMDAVRQIEEMKRKQQEEYLKQQEKIQELMRETERLQQQRSTPSLFVTALSSYVVNVNSTRCLLI